MSSSFRGFALDETNKISWSGVSESPANEGKRSPKLGDGHAFERSSRGGLIVDLELHIGGDDIPAFQSNLQGLAEVLRDPSEGYLILDTYRLACRPRPGKLKYLPPDDSIHASWPCRFESPNPFWEQTPSAIASKTLTNNAVSQESFTITYDADLAPSYPIFEIESLKASLVTGYEITLRNDSTGEEVRLLDFDLGQNDVLTVDPYTEQVYVSTQTTGNAVAPRRVDGVFWPLTGASITCIVKHNQLGLSPNFSVSTETKKWRRTFLA